MLFTYRLVNNLIKYLLKIIILLFFFPFCSVDVFKKIRNKLANILSILKRNFGFIGYIYRNIASIFQWQTCQTSFSGQTFCGFRKFYIFFIFHLTSIALESLAQEIGVIFIRPIVRPIVCHINRFFLSSTIE